MTLTLERARELPKVLLHDHLDGGLRVDHDPRTRRLDRMAAADDRPRRPPGVVHARRRDRRSAAVPGHVRPHARRDADRRVDRTDRLRGDGRPRRRRRRVRRGPVRARTPSAATVCPSMPSSRPSPTDSVGARRDGSGRRPPRSRSTRSVVRCAPNTGHSRSLSSSTGCGHGTTRWSPSTSPAPRPGSRPRCTPRRWRSPAPLTSTSRSTPASRPTWN